MHGSIDSSRRLTAPIGGRKPKRRPPPSIGCRTSGAPLNHIASIHQQILEFVAGRPDLARGTGPYSSPFRGRLFDSTDGAAISRQLDAGARVDVLLMGSNPNVQDSSTKILDPALDSDLPGFAGLVASGGYGHLDAGGAPAWDPMRAGRGWQTWAALAREVAAADRVAFANYVPWGSPDLLSFFGEPRMDGPGVVAFCDRLNRRIVATLRPRLLLVPRSLAEHRLMARTCFALPAGRLRQLPAGAVTARRFGFATGRVERDGVGIPALFLPHPGSLRFGAGPRERLIGELLPVIRELLGS